MRIPADHVTPELLEEWDAIFAYNVRTGEWTDIRAARSVGSLVPPGFPSRTIRSAPVVDYSTKEELLTLIRIIEADRGDLADDARAVLKESCPPMIA